MKVNKLRLTKKLLFIVGLILLVILGIYTWQRFAPVSKDGFSPQMQKRLEQKNLAKSKIDAQVLEKIDLEVAENTARQEVRKMPEFVLSLPSADWFSAEKMQVIVHQLGFSQDAVVEGIGQQAIWSEGVRMLAINSQLGTIDFSTAFNIGDVTLPKEVPTQDLAKSALLQFFEQTNLPTSFYDFDNLVFEFMTLGANGIIDKAFSATGPLLRINIGYLVSGVQIILPVESFVIVDGEGEIRNLSLFVPNIQQTGPMLTVISFNRAKQLLDDGAGVVIETADSNTTQLAIASFYPAYYLNQKTFYAIGQKRVLTPVYVFEGENGRVAVLAER